MNSRQLAFFKQRLLDIRRELLQQGQAMMDDMRDLRHQEIGDQGDRATREAMLSFDLRTRERHGKLLRKIEDAIRRIDSGEYGYCVETGEPIGIARLLARPMATLSLEAQSSREKRERLVNTH